MAQLKRPNLPDGPLKALITRLHELHARAGNPSLADIVRAQRAPHPPARRFSKDTVFRLFTNPPAKPPLPIVLEVGRILLNLTPGGPDVEEQVLDDLDQLWAAVADGRATNSDGRPAPAERPTEVVPATESLRVILRREVESDPEDRRDGSAARVLLEYLGDREMFPTLREVTPTALRLRHDPPGWTEEVPSRLPHFIPRDASGNLARLLRKAKTNGGFALLVGESCVGKSRMAYEIGKECVGDWGVLIPAPGDSRLLEQLARSSFVRTPLIVWLDDLQTFLQGPYFAGAEAPLSARDVELLLSRSLPIILLATMRSDAYRECIRAQSSGNNVLNGPHLETLVVKSFSKEERRRAKECAGEDGRILAALRDRDYNVTEHLAGAGRIVTRFETSSDSARAIVLAAHDANRIGIFLPASPDYLRSSYMGHRTYFADELDDFTESLRDVVETRLAHQFATAPLVAVPKPDRSGVLGYRLSDYLSRHLVITRLFEPIPATVWNALIEQTGDSVELALLADGARRRGLLSTSAALFREAIRRKKPSPFAAVVFADQYLDELMGRREGEFPQLLPIEERMWLPGEYDPYRTAVDETDEQSLEDLWNSAAVGDNEAAYRLAVHYLNANDRGALERLRGIDFFRGYSALHQLAIRNGDSEYLMQRALDNDESAESNLALLYCRKRDEAGLRSMIEARMVDYAPRVLSLLLLQRNDLGGLASLSGTWASAAEAQVVLLAQRANIAELSGLLSLSAQGHGHVGLLSGIW